MAEINLPYNSTGRVAYRSNLDSSIVNEIFRKSDENDRYIMKLINAIMGKNAQWSAVITYNKYDIVGTGKDIYMSKRDSNLNNVVTNADWWEKIDVGSLDVSDQLTKYALKEELPEWVVSETEPTSKDKIWIKPTASNELTELVETLKRLLAPELQTLPIGAYINYPTQRVIPAGFLIADGRSLKKSEYPELFNVLGYVYGGSGENFNLPNFSDGKFMRSIGGNAAGLGVVQQDAFQGHFHKWRDSTSVAGWAYSITGNTSNHFGNRDNASAVAEPKSDGVNGEPRTANETRPLNMSVVVLIKAKDVISPSAGQIDKSIVATEVKAGVVKLKNSITAQQEDAAVTEKAVREFAGITVTDNYVKLPGGFIMQWGKREVPNNQGKTIFPIAFPNKCLHIMINQYGSAAAAQPSNEQYVQDKDNAGFTRGMNTWSFYWVAFGY